MIPPRSVLAPVDFSDQSRVALTFAARLAHQCQATLHVLYVQPPLLEAAAEMAAVDLSRDTDAELTTFMQAAYPAGEWLPIHHVETGAPADVIPRVAHERSADLIVMGPRGLSRLGRALLGSTTEAVVERAGAPVVVVPPTWSAPLLTGPGLAGTGPIVVGIKHAERRGHALAAAGSLAAALGTGVEVVHVRRPDQDEATARRGLAAVLLDAGAAATTTLHVIDGPTADGLLTFLRTRHLDHAILWLGRHDPGSARNTPRDILRLLATAHVPVVIG